MTAFPISEAREAGHHTRNLARWALDLVKTSRQRRTVIPLSPEARECWHESISCDLAAAFKARREYQLILRRMRDVPGFLQGYQEARL